MSMISMITSPNENLRDFIQSKYSKLYSFVKLFVNENENYFYDPFVYNTEFIDDIDTFLTNLIEKIHTNNPYKSVKKDSLYDFEINIKNYMFNVVDLIDVDSVYRFIDYRLDNLCKFIKYSRNRNFKLLFDHIIPPISEEDHLKSSYS